MTIDARLRELEHAATDVDSTQAAFEAARTWIRRFVFVAEHQLLVLALWSLLTYTVEITDCVPYLAITSPEKGCGKTRALETLEAIVARPWMTGRTTAAVLARKIDKEHPTLLLDESDAAFRGDREYAETLRGVLNTGYLRSGRVSLCTQRGKNIAYIDLSTFGMKAIAGIGELPDTIADRSIPIRLERKLAHEPTERFRRRHIERDAEALRQLFEDWSAAFCAAEYHSEPEGLDDLPDRAADIWEPLLVIAEACGSGIAEEARAAATELSGSVRNDASLGARILWDVKAIFDQRPENDRIASAEIVRELLSLEDATYAPCFGREFDARMLASRLRPFGIRPQTVRTDGRHTPKGYFREQFADAWARYVPEKAQQPQQAKRAIAAQDARVADVADVADSAGEVETVV